MKGFACSRCLLSEDVPGVRVDSGRICSVCKEHDRRWGDWGECRAERLATLHRILDDARKKRRIYDVLIPLSGGKDSTYVLYVCRKRFDLKCLAVTFDNGFLTKYARENIRKAVDVLGVDHVHYGVNKQLLMRLYRFFFLKTGFFCSVCMRGIDAAIGRIASVFGVSVVIDGTSLRTEEYVAPEFFEGGDLRFFKEVLKGDPLEREASALMYGGGCSQIADRVFKYKHISLPNYVDWDYDQILKTISSELGWRAHRVDAEHTDCKVDDIVNYFRYIKFPALVPEMLRFSKLVTVGEMTREEAQRRISENKAAIAEPDSLEWFLGALGISRGEMDEVVADPLRHMKYIKEPGRAWRALRTAKHLLLDPFLG